MAIRAYKFRIYPNKAQQSQLISHLMAAKALYNDCLALTKHVYAEYGLFPSKRTLQEMSKTSGLYSQTAQVITHRLLNSIGMKIRNKKRDRFYGFPRFKSFERMKSLPYPQFGFKLSGKRLEVTPFGAINIKFHREINGRIKTMVLKREPSGKWFVIFTAEESITPKENNGNAVGMDMGLENLATLSDSIIIKNPRHMRKHEATLTHLGKNLSMKKKGSKNRLKAKLKLARAYEKLKNVRRDFLHKLSIKLVNDYSIIALEKLNTKSMIEQRFGKSITDASWNIFANMLCYKAEGAGCKVVFVDPKETSSMCSRCGVIVQKSLSERTHICSACGFSADRDINAAINILNRSTGGTPGSNASGDGSIVLSVKEEVNGFSRW